MERKDFIALLGMGASSLILGCFACSKNQGTSTAAPAGVDFTLDLTQPDNAPLTVAGGFLYNSGIIVAKTLTGQFIAVQQSCTHQNFSLTYIADSHEFYCNGHGGIYSETGRVLGGPPPAPLRTYNTSLNGNLLRVYS
jgi:Rieske Fe-S protein